ncbi:hypothetical protein ACE6H2_011826 [Prunus campanulata]
MSKERAAHSWADLERFSNPMKERDDLHQKTQEFIERMEIKEEVSLVHQERDSKGMKESHHHLDDDEEADFHRQFPEAGDTRGLLQSMRQQLRHLHCIFGMKWLSNFDSCKINSFQHPGRKLPEASPADENDTREAENPTDLLQSTHKCFLFQDWILGTIKKSFSNINVFQLQGSKFPEAAQAIGDKDSETNNTSGFFQSMPKQIQFQGFILRIKNSKAPNINLLSTILIISILAVGFLCGVATGIEQEESGHLGHVNTKPITMMILAVSAYLLLRFYNWFSANDREEGGQNEQPPEQDQDPNGNNGHFVRREEKDPVQESMRTGKKNEDWRKPISPALATPLAHLRQT